MAKTKNKTIRKLARDLKSNARREKNEAQQAHEEKIFDISTTEYDESDDLEALKKTESEILQDDLEPIQREILKGPKIRKTVTKEEELQFLGEWLAQEYLSVELNYDPLAEHHPTRNNKIQACDGKDPNGREIEIRTQKRNKTNFVIPKDYIERVKTVERLVICEYDNTNTIKLWEVIDRSVNEKNKTFALPIKQMQLLLSFDNQEFTDKMRGIEEQHLASWQRLKEGGLQPE